MRNWVSILILSAAAAGWADASKQHRLTWAPYPHLEKGLRSVPWVKDPFFPELNGLKLSGIISNEMAFINGRWLRPGEEVDGYLVKEIQPDQVTLSRRSEILVLKMED